MNPAHEDRSTRREFLKQAALAAGCTAAGGISGCGTANRGKDQTHGPAPGVFIVCDPADAVATSEPVRWSVDHLRASLSAGGIANDTVQRVDQVPAGAVCVMACGSSFPAAQAALSRAGVSMPDSPESFGLVSGGDGDAKYCVSTLACGSDVRGLVYAVLELADRVDHAPVPLAALELRRAVIEKPANKVRSIMRVFASDVEDKGWYNDKAFWEQYLSMLAAQRFNRFALALGLGYDFTSRLRDTYFHFAYPFLVSIPDYDVRARELPDAERDHNLEMLQFISDETARRGLHFQLGLWTHAYKWTDSPGVNYTIEGLSPRTHAAYCRAALETLLKACPSIRGVTFRIHGESGVAEGSYEFWKTVFEGVVRSGRRIEIDMHAKGIDRAMIDLAVATGLPVSVSPKYWAEHMGLPYHQAAIRPTELPRQGRKDEGFFSMSSGSRSFLRYGYGDLLAENRSYSVLHRMWPGSQRLLLWGDPVFAAAYGRASSFCGSSGVELFEPLSFKGRKGSGLPGGRDGYADASLRPTRDYEKYLYGYRLWGRLLYNPEAEPDTWRRFLNKEYGPAATACEAALSHASRILPLFTTAHTPSAANNNYWPEIYTNMSIVDASRRHPYGDTPSPKRFGMVSPLDSQLFARVDDYAEALIQSEPVAKYSPVEVAQWLEELAETATMRLTEAESRIADHNSPAFRRLAVDVAIQSGLGRFFAAKLRAGVLYAIYSRTADPSALDEALGAYRVAREAWAWTAARAQDVYVRDITFGLEGQLRGHWQDRLAAIDEDISDMQKSAQVPRSDGQTIAVSPALIAQAIQVVLSRRSAGIRNLKSQIRDCVHTPPPPFRPGQSVTVELALSGQQPVVTAPRLRYRQVHQAQPWRTVDMQVQGNRCQASIPGEYSDSPYPLEYYFELRNAAGQIRLYPGLDTTLSNQPYLVVRQA